MHPIPCRASLMLAALIAFTPAVLRAAYSAETAALAGRQLTADQVALSPDGKRLAYTIYDNRALAIVLVDIESRNSRRIDLAQDQDDKKPRSRLLSLQWSGSGRLVLVSPEYGVFSYDANGNNPVKLWAADAPVSQGNISGNLNAIHYPPTLLPRDGLDPEHILLQAHLAPIRANDSTILQTYENTFSIDAKTGVADLTFPKLLSRGHLAYGTNRYLNDREGRVRMTYMQARPGFWQFVYTPKDEVLRQTFEDPLPIDRTFSGNGQRGPFTVDTLPPPRSNYIERSFPVGFDYDQSVFYAASDAGRDNYGLFSMDTATKKETDLSAAFPGFGLSPFESMFADSDLLVFDHAQKKLVGIRESRNSPTHWLDPEFAKIQEKLNAKMAGLPGEIVQWDDARSRLLILVRRDGDAGRYFFYLPGTDALEPGFDRAPWLTAVPVETKPFSVERAPGDAVSGWLSVPKGSAPTALIVYARSGPFVREDGGFNRTVETFARSGAAVLRLNYRGTAGLGKKDFAAFRLAPDAGPVADIVAAVGKATADLGIDKERVAIIGEGFGGYLALRAVQLQPSVFRCVVAVNPMTDLPEWTDQPLAGQKKSSTALPLREVWDHQPSYALVRVWGRKEIFSGAKGSLSDLSPATHPELVTKPILILQNPENLDTTPSASTRLVSRAGSKSASKAVNIDWGVDNGVPDATKKYYDEIGGFLNANLFK